MSCDLDRKPSEVVESVQEYYYYDHTRGNTIYGLVNTQLYKGKYRTKKFCKFPLGRTPLMIKRKIIIKYWLRVTTDWDAPELVKEL